MSARRRYISGLAQSPPRFQVGSWIGAIDDFFPVSGHNSSIGW
jgi:hypothetical protein